MYLKIVYYEKGVLFLPIKFHELSVDLNPFKNLSYCHLDIITLMFFLPKELRNFSLNGSIII